ncbi:MAG: HAMP domain-containing sensor histidine kinase, partial [Halobacteriales archaeon]|nr:HAMP domain-containing sensor histidine kinase [Halobacteriales archaeon]
EVLNRLLRHEVLNAVTVIRGYTHIGEEGRPGASQIVADSADAIVETIEEMKYLTRREHGTGSPSVSIDLAASITDSVATVREEFPEAEISVGEVPGGLTVLANERLDRVFTHLLENAVVYAETDPPAVAVDVTATAGAASVAISDEGPGLPASQRALLEEGTIEEFDDPGAGFGLNIVRLLVESYDGRIETEVTETGSTVTVILPRRETDDTGLLPDHSGLAGIRPAVPHLIVTLGAAILAGIVYGIVAEQLGGSVAAIGVFYGFQNPVVGWITHEFHSAVFGFVFSGLVTLAPARYRNHLPAYALIGLAWGFFLWVVAAGIIAPVWLRLLGIQVPVPTFSPELLVSHLAWGLTLGVLTAWGYDRITPRMAGLGRRLVRDRPGGKP